MTPDEYCQNKAAASGSSFYYSFLFIKGPRRLAITALYAFCREVDDIVDESTDTAVARTRLAWWRSELDAMSKGKPTHPVTKALAPHMSAFNIEKRWLIEIIDGMAMDLEQDRYLDFEGLKLYCHRAAGVVGCAAAQIFGASDPQTQTYAERLGLALQLTNIIRDVGEDARRGRIYLPIEDLQRFEVSQQDILASRYCDGFTALMKFQADRARQAYSDAYDVLPAADRRDQRPGLMMAAIYATLLREIQRDKFKVLHQRITLTPLRKLLIASRTWLTAKAPLP
ncbi:MAG: presqualene diphosphate synthase HpnD [Burkholderiaceae bacterium]